MQGVDGMGSSCGDSWNGSTVFFEQIITWFNFNIIGRFIFDRDDGWVGSWWPIRGCWCVGGLTMPTVLYADGPLNVCDSSLLVAREYCKTNRFGKLDLPFSKLRGVGITAGRRLANISGNWGNVIRWNRLWGRMTGGGCVSHGGRIMIVMMTWQWCWISSSTSWSKLQAWKFVKKVWQVEVFFSWEVDLHQRPHTRIGLCAKKNPHQQNVPQKINTSSTSNRIGVAEVSQDR